MGTSVEAVYAEKLKEDIRKACTTLEKLGYDSLVIVVSQDSHTEMGSEKGKDFVERYDLVEEFVRYCEGFRLEEEIIEDEENKIELKEVEESEKAILEKKIGFYAQKKLNQSKEMVPQTKQVPYICSVEQNATDSTVVSESSLPEEELNSDEGEEELNEDRDKKPFKSDIGYIISKSKVVAVQPLPDSLVVGKQTHTSGTSVTNPSYLEMKTTLPNKRLSDHGSLSKQQKTPKETPGKTFKCDQCDKTYARLENLTYHQRSKHTGEKPYKCRTCGKAFVCRGQLNNHRAIHSDSTPFVCNVCGQMFKRDDYLWRHKAIHSSTYRYMCDICGRGYDDATCLKKHKMRHTGEKPHGCEVCGKRFLMHHVLVAHKRIHTGEKPFTCDICGQHFRMKKNLATHRRRKHEM